MLKSCMLCICLHTGLISQEKHKLTLTQLDQKFEKDKFISHAHHCENFYENNFNMTLQTSHTEATSDVIIARQCEP